VALALSEGDPVKYLAAMKMRVEKALALMVWRKRMYEEMNEKVRNAECGVGSAEGGVTVTETGRGRRVRRVERW
jgi:hypothetical protein